MSYYIVSLKQAQAKTIASDSRNRCMKRYSVTTRTTQNANDADWHAERSITGAGVDKSASSEEDTVQ
ncbi:hypothetical protein C0Z18_17695 [Trinickia dabaoshanensis]|uniref:Uncharacterized protein n=1 Tax=Trinickia dabaoshanensis TaxID=564714 RepID=A0A2N7VLP8_9BURK|nr:hypothetical protein C0Z18_17695 [Trinickia dabaoshanensis]